MTATLYIVRHGNTFERDEIPRRIGARSDVPLVESGREQATAVGRAFRDAGVRFDRVFASSSTRARETADLILSSLGYPSMAIEPQAWLGEIDYGPDEGLPEPDVVKRIGEQALAEWDTRGVAPADWTTDREMRLEGWRSLIDGARYRPQTILLVASNGASRFALTAGSVATCSLPSLKLQTGAWGRLIITLSGVTLADWDVRP
jgi:broad specificity phosphatase PhoE